MFLLILSDFANLLFSLANKVIYYCLLSPESEMHTPVQLQAVVLSS